MNGSLIQEMVGRKVQIYTVHGGGEHQVVGTLEAFDGVWLKVVKSEGEIMFFTVYQTRLVRNFL